jgi:hypothetical protein
MRAAFEIVLPLPSELDLHPLWNPPLVERLVQHRAFTPLSVLFLILYAISTAVYNPSFDSFGGWGTFFTGTAVYCVWALAALSRMDRRMMLALMSTFEWWLLIGNLLMYIICRGIEQRWELGSTLLVYFCFGYGLCIFSLDAMVTVSRAAKGVVLVSALSFGTIVFVNEHLSSEIAQSEDVRIFFYQSTTSSLRGSSLLTIMFFFCKYFLAILFRPRRLLIVSSPILYQLQVPENDSESEQLAMVATERSTSAVQSLKHYEARLLAPHEQEQSN